MGKNKEEFMKDREKDFQTNGLDNDSLDDFNNLIDGDSLYYYRELNNAKELLSKCKTLIADMVLVNLHRTGKKVLIDWDVDVMKRAQETLRELTEIINNEK